MHRFTNTVEKMECKLAELRKQKGGFDAEIDCLFADFMDALETLHHELETVMSVNDELIEKYDDKEAVWADAWRKEN